MGSNLLKQSKLRADEIVHYAYDFAHQYDREYGSPGYDHSFLPEDELLRILTDKAMNAIPNCDKDSAFHVAVATKKILETMGITVKVACSPAQDEADAAQGRLCRTAVSEESHQMNMEVNALDPQRDIGGEVPGEQSPANSMADEGLAEPDMSYWHPFGLGMGTERENTRYGSAEEEHGNFPDTGTYDEKEEERRRKVAEVEANYAEDGEMFDKAGNYLCDDCSQFDPAGACGTVEDKISGPTGSCSFWEVSGQVLVQIESKFTQKEAGYTERPNVKGFGCHRCEYGAEAQAPDSTGRTTWCSYWGTHVLPNACCAKNEGDDDVFAPGGKTASRKVATVDGGWVTTSGEVITFERRGEEYGHNEVAVENGLGADKWEALKNGNVRWVIDSRSKMFGVQASVDNPQTRALMLKALEHAPAGLNVTVEFGYDFQEFKTLDEAYQFLTTKTAKVAGQWGERSYDSDSVQDILDGYRQGGISFDERVPEENVGPLLSEIHEIQFSNPEAAQDYIGVVVWLLEHGASVPDPYRSRAANLAQDLISNQEYIQGWADPEDRLIRLKQEYTMLAGKTAGEKPKCPHCGSTEYALMPTDFETAKCSKCGKNWDHGIVEGVNDPSEKVAAHPGSGIRGDEAVDFYKPTQTLPPRYDQRKHIDENQVDDPIKDDLALDKKKMEGPTPATGHAPLRRDLAQRSFTAAAKQLPEEIVIEAATRYLDKLDTITEEQFASNGDAFEKRALNLAMAGIHFDDLSGKMLFVAHLIVKLLHLVDESTSEDVITNGVADELRAQLRSEISKLEPKEFGKLFAADDEYWLRMVQMNEENAKKRFLESPDIRQIAQDNGWTMDQAWDEMGSDFANELYDPRNRLIAKQATLDANKPNPEAWNEVEAIRANLNYLITGEHFRNLSAELQAKLESICAELEDVSQDWDTTAGHPPEASPFVEPERSEPHLAARPKNTANADDLLTNGGWIASNGKLFVLRSQEDDHGVLAESAGLGSARAAGWEGRGDERDALSEIDALDNGHIRVEIEDGIYFQMKGLSPRQTLAGFLRSAHNPRGTQHSMTTLGASGEECMIEWENGKTKSFDTFEEAADWLESL
jgi:hypothetical protein